MAKPRQCARPVTSLATVTFVLRNVGMVLGRARLEDRSIGDHVVRGAREASPADQLADAMHFPTLLPTGGGARIRAAGFYRGLQLLLLSRQGSRSACVR